MCDQLDDVDEDFVPNLNESEEESEKENIKDGPIQNTAGNKAVKG